MHPRKPSFLRALPGVAALLLSVSCPTALLAQDGEYSPNLKPASDEGEQAIAGFTVMDGFEVELVAAEPFLANPVAFCIDSLGRFYVAETFRHFAGVTDMRRHMNWLDEDLANQTVEDRVAMLRRHEGDKLAERYEVEHDRVRMLVDTDGDGVVDKSTVFADGFNKVATGIGAGLLERDGEVWFTCIPDLWKLVDEDGDGVAEKREVLSTGYGVNIALLGHDLHGLRFGPDGRLYFSIGDRGFHVEHEGKVFAHPHAGAILRCNPDGSNLEVYATGVRNPQELLFDEHGNLFTGDNNSDGGDRARWVWILEGGDCGWRYSYQWINQPNRRGPWNGEKQWHPKHAGQPAFLVPPIVNFADGPSGITAYPGTGFGPEFRGYFFLCDFRGSPRSSGIHCFTNKRKGAGFEMVDAKRLIWNTLPTDCEFGPDGSLYLTDWVNGWDKPGKGRIYRISNAAHRNAALVKETAALLRAGPAGMRARRPAELVALLNHTDQRVRQEAHFALAERGVAGEAESLAILREVALTHTDRPLARLHAIWAIGMVARKNMAVLDGVGVSLLSAADPEVRCQISRVHGDQRSDFADRADAKQITAGLLAMLKDGDLRVRLFGAEALGKLNVAAAIPALFDVLAENDGQDPWLRHAAAHAIAIMDDRAAVMARAGDGHAEVRMGVLLAMRKWRAPEIARFLKDSEVLIVQEAARAIYEQPIMEAWPALAAALDDAPLDNAYLLRRMLNANLRLGVAGAQRIADFVKRGKGPAQPLVEGLDLLTDWAQPKNRDRVNGAWRPFEDERSLEQVRPFARLVAGSVLSSGDAQRQEALVRFISKAGDPDMEPLLVELVRDDNRDVSVRSLALETIVAAKSGSIAATMKFALRSNAEGLRAAAVGLLGRVGGEESLELLRNAMSSPSVAVRKGALGALGQHKAAGSSVLLRVQLNLLNEGRLPGALMLELVEAVEKKKDGFLTAMLATWRAEAPEANSVLGRRECLEGGNAQEGRRVFFNKAEVTCLRCHQVGDKGGEEIGGQAGPNLSDVAGRLTREQLLDSVLNPNANIAEGFENWLLLLDDGSLVSGRITAENKDFLVIDTKDEGPVEIDIAVIEKRKRDISAMPSDLHEKLSARELRDLVEFLSQRKD